MGFPRHGILRQVIISFSRGSSPPRDWTQVSCMQAGRFLITEPQGKPQLNLIFSVIFTSTFLLDMQKHLMVILIWISLKPNDAEQLFTPLLGQLQIFVTCLFKYLSFFLTGLFIFSLIYKISLYILDTTNLSATYIVNIFSQSKNCLFICLTVVFWKSGDFNLGAL